jgi:hypothetical protein
VIRIRNPWYLVVAFSIVFFCLALYNISEKSLTCDEIVYIPAGYSYLKTFDYWMNREHPPLAKLLAATPLLFLQPILPTDSPLWRARNKQLEFSREFLIVRNTNTDQLVFWARVPMILVGVLLGVFVFVWARDLYGEFAGYLALILHSFSPTILAEATRATTDIGVTCFSFISMYYLWKFLSKGQKPALWLSGVFLGLSLATKFTALYLIPLFLLFAGLGAYWEYRVRSLSFFYKTEQGRGVLRNLIRIFATGFGVLVLTYGVIHFDRFISGLLFQFLHNKGGHPAFLMGEHSMGGWPHYFLVVFLIKTPLALLLLTALICLWYRNTHPQTKQALKQDLFLLLPIIVVLGAATMSRLNIGVRYILPIYPFLFVFVSQVVLISWRRMTKYAVLTGLTTWYIVATLAIAPHYLAYFNETIGGPDRGYRYLIDSNIDVGQDLKPLAEYVRRHNIEKINLSYFGHDSCAYRGINCGELGCTPKAGILAVSVNHLVGLTPAHAKCLAWLRDFKPIDDIGHSILLYDIQERDVEKVLERFSLDPSAESGKFCQWQAQPSDKQSGV